ncbi:MAG: hypothetical protein AAGJ46_10440 [Planctomycetota bacterium]
MEAALRFTYHKGIADWIGVIELPYQASMATNTSAAGFGFWTITSLVLLRLAIGWHFYSEGVEKLEPGFTSAGLLRDAKGPLAPTFQSFAPPAPGYAEHFAQPQAAGLSSDQQTEQAEWQQAYNKRLAEYKAAKETPLAEFPPHAPYTEWASVIAEEWEAKRDQAIKLGAKTEDAEQAYRETRQRLADYFAGEADAIEEWRHELWRLEQMKAKPGAESLAFQQERIAGKRGETGRKGLSWAYAVDGFEEQYVADLAGLATKDDSIAAVVAELRTRSPLDWINPTVTCVVLGVGVCLMLGLATRVAAVAGAGFLLSVMASQPPWVADANTQYFGYQIAEFAALLVLAATAAGRWYGIDSVLRRCCSIAC